MFHIAVKCKINKKIIGETLKIAIQIGSLFFVLVAHVRYFNCLQLWHAVECLDSWLLATGLIHEQCCSVFKKVYEKTFFIVVTMYTQKNLSQFHSNCT